METPGMSGSDNEFLASRKGGQPASGEGKTGPILAMLGLVGWLLVLLSRSWIWSGYDEQSDVLLIGLVAGQLATLILIVAGGAASVTLCAVGGFLSLARALRSEAPDRWSIAGLVAALIGVGPVVWLTFKILSHQGP